MFIVNTWRGRRRGETGVSEFPRLEIVNILFHSDPCLQKLVYVMLHGRQESELPNFCLELVLPNQCKQSVSLPSYSPFSHVSFQAVFAHLQPPSSWSILFLFYGEQRPPGLRGLGEGMGRGRVSPHPWVCRNRTLVSLLGLCRFPSAREFQPPLCDPVFYRVLRDEGQRSSRLADKWLPNTFKLALVVCT